MVDIESLAKEMELLRKSVKEYEKETEFIPINFKKISFISNVIFDFCHVVFSVVELSNIDVCLIMTNVMDKMWTVQRISYLKKGEKK